jgi:O-Antigen ligase
MRLFVFVVFVFLGIGRNLPFNELYFFGLGIADYLFGLLTCLWLRGSSVTRQARVLRTPIFATMLISVIALISMLLNAPVYGAEIKDVFEILKYLYLVVVMVVTSHYTMRMGLVPALGFVVGIIISGIVALRYPMNPDILGTLQIYNPNVIGNVLSVSIVFCSFAILGGYPVIGGFLAICAASIAFFTFSKGAWLMSIFGLVACYFAATNQGEGNEGLLMRFKRNVVYFLLLGMLATVYVFWDLMSLIVQTKIAATDFESSAAEGGSVSARAGLILSAFYMFMRNPAFGVGISNFEQVNNLQQDDLGDSYYEDDNPNSAWFYVLGCMGLPAFILFSCMFYWFLSRVYRISHLNRKARALYTTSVGIVFFIGGNVQLEMLTAYYYWVALGVVPALSTRGSINKPISGGAKNNTFARPVIGRVFPRRSAILSGGVGVRPSN